jgi:pSer/pThr/pTyr-binding forkhead associated (FHA) protein
MKARLVLSSKDRQTVQEVPFDRPSITIGRKPSNDLAFNRPEISGSHAAFVFENNEYFVMDLGSTNGTLLNGAQLVAREKYSLQDKDLVTVNPYSIQFIVEDESMDTMIEVLAQPAAQKKMGSGTAPDLEASKPPDEKAKPSAPPPEKRAEAAPHVEQPKPEPSPPRVATPAAVVIPEAKTPSAFTDYIWLAIGGILVLAAIGLIVFLLTN